MLVTFKPENYDYQPSRAQPLDPSCRCTHIIYGRNKQYFANWAGNLSLKTFYGGKAFYDTGLGRYEVGEDNFLILNEKQPYSITIDTSEKIQSFCIFFEKGFAEEVLQGLTKEEEFLLDNPNNQSNVPIDFVQRLYPKDALIGPDLANLLTSINQGNLEEFAVREQLHQIMQKMLRVRSRVFTEIDKLAAKRSATREELYKRLYRARDFLESSFTQKITLSQTAGIACLSQNHFLRTFNQLFGQTPNQYLTRLRLKKAR
ncbi:MAG: helix-turn-helix transcriptional regulator, partial [Pyrinomonadaceae bacterium]|nr:helix-turn-helix transcriptional regulator [Pyrinomonadaceae bacterium]